MDEVNQTVGALLVAARTERFGTAISPLRARLGWDPERHDAAKIELFRIPPPPSDPGVGLVSWILDLRLVWAAMGPAVAEARTVRVWLDRLAPEGRESLAATVGELLDVSAIPVVGDVPTKPPPISLAGIGPPKPIPTHQCGEKPVPTRRRAHASGWADRDGSGDVDVGQRSTP